MKNKIVFLGNMNNLPFTFAKELKDRGFNVVFYLYNSPSYTLDRPECLSNSVSYPYPDWIKEMPLTDNLSIVKLPFLFFVKNKYLNLLADADIIVLNGDWISLGGYINDNNKKVIALFAGDDLDVKADYRNIRKFSNYAANKFKFLYVIYPILLVCSFYIIFQQRKGIRRANKINYFPTGIIPRADQILQKIMKGKDYERLELRGSSFSAIPYIRIKDNSKFFILNFTRFLFTDLGSPDNKRNDIMIEGIAKFIKDNKIQQNKIKIVFFNKGADVGAAIKLIEKLGITKFIEWYEPVSQMELNQFIADCDVAFDQLGMQWIGYGIASMAMGRPLIANGRPEIFEKLTKEVSPVCQAVNADEVAAHLKVLYYNQDKKNEIGLNSRAYVLNHYNIDKTIDFIIN